MFRVCVLGFLAVAVLLSYVGPSASQFLVWDADANTNSGPAIRSALFAVGFGGDYTTDIVPYLGSLSNYCAVFICLGVYDSNYVLTPGPAVDSLVSYLNNGGKIYMEGGDTWAFDSQTALHAYFNITGDVDGFSDVGTELGQAATFTEGMSIVYSPTADNQYMDRLKPDSMSTAFIIFRNESPSYDNGIAYDDGGGSYKTVGVSFEFGGLQDGASPSTRTDLADSIMSFFGCMPPVDSLNACVTSIGNPGQLVLPNASIAPRATVKNLGTNTVSFNVTCRIDSGPANVFTDMQPVSNLANDSTQQVSFANWTPGAVGNCYDVMVYTQLAGDQMPANDTLFVTSCVFDTTWEIRSQYTYSPPTINGVMSPGEWTDATQRDVSNILDKTLSGVGTAYLYVKNDTTSFYMALDVVGDLTDDLYDAFWAYFDDNGDGAWPPWPLPNEGEFTISEGGAVDSLSFGALNSDSCRWWQPCTLAKAQRSTVTSGHRQFECAFALSLIPDTFCYSYADLQASACDTVGLWLAAIDVFTSNWLAWWPTNASTPIPWECAPGRMGKLILGCPASILDAGLISIDAPPILVCPDSTYNVRATVRNFGNAALDTIDATCYIIDVSVPDTVYAGLASTYNLGVGAQQQLNFIPWTVMRPAPDSFLMMVNIVATGDTLTNNNSISRTLYNCETTGAEEGLRSSSLRPMAYGLSQNRPNPFSQSTSIHYALPARADVRIAVFDVTGSEVRILVSDELEPGFYNTSWDGRDSRGVPVANGVYFLKMQADNYGAVRNLIVLK